MVGGHNSPLKWSPLKFDFHLVGKPWNRGLAGLALGSLSSNQPPGDPRADRAELAERVGEFLQRSDSASLSGWGLATIFKTNAPARGPGLSVVGAHGPEETPNSPMGKSGV